MLFIRIERAILTTEPEQPKHRSLTELSRDKGEGGKILSVTQLTDSSHHFRKRNYLEMHRI